MSGNIGIWSTGIQSAISQTNGTGGGGMPIASNGTGLNWSALSTSGPKTQMAGGWASAIGQAADLAGSFIKPKSEYEGEYGHITAGMDTAYDNISNTLMNIPGWGTIAGGAMKAASLLGKGLGRLGGGTDGKTKKDAVLGSSFFNWNVGLINGFGGKKTMSIDKDYTTWARAGNSYTGSQQDFNTSLTKIGKYGKWSSGARNRANNQIAIAGQQQNILGSVMDENWTRMESLAQQQEMNNQDYINLMNGGYDQVSVLAAKKGGILSSAHAFQVAKRVANKYNPLFEYKEVEKEQENKNEDIDKFQNGGQMNLIPEGALHARKHNLEEVNPDLKGEITHKGIPVISIETGEQTAEIENNEIILNKELTDQIEELRKQYHEAETQKDKDEIARKAGELLTMDIVENTDDRTGLFKSIKV